MQEYGSASRCAYASHYYFSVQNVRGKCQVAYSLTCDVRLITICDFDPHCWCSSMAFAIAYVPRPRSRELQLTSRSRLEDASRVSIGPRAHPCSRCCCNYYYSTYCPTTTTTTTATTLLLSGIASCSAIDSTYSYTFPPRVICPSVCLCVCHIRVHC